MTKSAIVLFSCPFGGTHEVGRGYQRVLEGVANRGKFRGIF
jgi:hypothetical protein